MGAEGNRQSTDQKGYRLPPHFCTLLPKIPSWLTVQLVEYEDLNSINTKVWTASDDVRGVSRLWSPDARSARRLLLMCRFTALNRPTWSSNLIRRPWLTRFSRCRPNLRPLLRPQPRQPIGRHRRLPNLRRRHSHRHLNPRRQLSWPLWPLPRSRRGGSGRSGALLRLDIGLLGLEWPLGMG